MKEYTLQDLYDACTEVINDLDIIKKDLNEKISDGVCDDLKEMFNKDIRKGFYDYAHFRPRKYVREGSLFEAYNIKKTKDGVEYDFGAEYMPRGLHRRSEDGLGLDQYIFEQSFIHGYHGGANKIGNVEESKYKQPHPNPGVPYWRRPFPNGENIPYQFWYFRPAPQESDPPKKKIERDLGNYMTKKSPTTIKRYYEDRVDDAFNLIESKYKLFEMMKQGD